MVAPHVGAWIETLTGRGGERPTVSHPTWVRGLKRFRPNCVLRTSQSHPTWVRGLKQTTPVGRTADGKSHPTWVRGLKHELSGEDAIIVGRTPRGCVD